MTPEGTGGFEPYRRYGRKSLPGRGAGLIGKAGKSGSGRVGVADGMISNGSR